MEEFCHCGAIFYDVFDFVVEAAELELVAELRDCGFGEGFGADVGFCGWGVGGANAEDVGD